MRDGIILITWVDDCLIFAKNEAIASTFIKEMQQQFVLTEEEDVSAYLGVQMDINESDDTITMTRPFLIERIISSLGSAIADANTKDTPAVYKERYIKTNKVQTENSLGTIGH